MWKRREPAGGGAQGLGRIFCLGPSGFSSGSGALEWGGRLGFIAFEISFVFRGPALHGDALEPWPPHRKLLIGSTGATQAMRHRPGSLLLRRSWALSG